MNRPGRVRELFDEAVARPPGERDDFLRSAVPDDPELRAEVASLLAAHDAPDELFDRPLPERFGATRAAASLIGRDLGAYRITREIGRGGMGTVYEAVRADDQFAKRVAIKMLRSGIDSATALRRFRREQEIQAALAHPNIATLLDAGATDEGAPYLVLEYVDGVPLDVYADRHRLPLAARLDLIRQVIQAVQHAHRQLVVHRDLKPSNILVTADGVVKLLDFGISKLLDDTAGHTTTDGSSGFTTAYASPEQLKGEAVSTATDVYSLGTVLFRLLTGRHPFEIDDLTPVAAWKTICEEEPRPPSAVATAAAAAAMGYPGPERLRRALQGELDAIVLMALRKEPGRRYSTADALGEDLLNYLKGLPVQARPDSPGYRLGKLVRRNRLAAAALALAFVAMGSGTAVALWQAREARASAAAADQERLTAQRVSTFLQSVFSSADASWRGRGAGRGPNASILEVVDAAAGRVDAELGGDPAVAEALEQTLVSIYRSLGQSEKAGCMPGSCSRYLRARGAGPEDLAQGLTNLSNLPLCRRASGLVVGPRARSVRALRRGGAGNPRNSAWRSTSWGWCSSRSAGRRKRKSTWRGSSRCGGNSSVLTPSPPSD
ncbi:MAG: serine/threonine-protein kinase [Gemmatimonadales bacterium]